MILKQMLDAGTLSQCVSHWFSGEGNTLPATPVISMESATGSIEAEGAESVKLSRRQSGQRHSFCSNFYIFLSPN